MTALAEEKSFLVGLECLCQLVGAGSGFEAAANALHTVNGILHLHAAQQMGDSLQVAVAAAGDAAVLDGVPFHIDLHIVGADALGAVLDGGHQ